MDRYKKSHDAEDCFARLKDKKGNLLVRKTEKKTYICDCLDSDDCYGCAFYKPESDVKGELDD